MDRPRQHDIDELAQRVLRNALPPSWISNDQSKNDYAKDYLYEIGEQGSLTGTSFFVQLKGQDRVALSPDGKTVKFYLKIKHATYYLDKVKDLPVFLVVVDVNQEKGWWLFLQPALEADQSWRSKKSVPLQIPIANDLSQIDLLREAIEEAKKWIRTHHPAAIHEAIAAEKERVKRLDPRFESKVSFLDNLLMFEMSPREEVPITLTFSASNQEQVSKLGDLIDRGAVVAFKPGEVAVKGTKLLERLETEGGHLQCSLTLDGTLSLTAKDPGGKELGQLADLPGTIRGGRKELRYEGGIPNSPLSIGLGPIAIGMGGAVDFNLNLRKWTNQRLLQLAYFDKINNFLQVLAAAATVHVQCQYDGNDLFGFERPFEANDIIRPLSKYTAALAKARRVCEHCRINPTWSVSSFDYEAQQASEELFAILFGDGWVEAVPRLRLRMTADSKSFRFDQASGTQTPRSTFVSANGFCKFMGETLDLGRIVYEYTETTIALKSHDRNGTPKRPTKKKVGSVKFEVVGTENSVKKIRAGTPNDAPSRWTGYQPDA